MENEAIGFSARFGGQPMQVMVPINALIAIYARENGAGMVFGQEPELDSDDEELETSDIDESAGPQLSVTGPADESQVDAPDKEKKKEEGKAKKKPTLRVVK